MQDPKKYVSGLELGMPRYAIESIEPFNALESALQSGDEEKLEAYINNRSLISFASAVNGQNRQDVLNSTLLAQLAANKKVPDDSKLEDWYKTYTEVLSQIGWTVQAKEFSVFRTDKGVFEMEAAILDILGAGMSGNYIAIITKTLEALKKLSSTDNKIIAFERNTHSLEKGTFQLALADETNGAVSLRLGGFIVKAKNEIKRILFFKSTKEKTELTFSTMQCTLNNDVYSVVRKTVLDKLSDSASRYIAAIEI